MTAISLVQWNCGIATPSINPAAAVKTTSNATSRPASRAEVHGARRSTSPQARQSSAGGRVTSRCRSSFARSTCHGVTGRLCSCHSCSPSSETDGTVRRFIPATSTTVKVSSTAPSSRAGSRAANARSASALYPIAPLRSSSASEPMAQLSR